MKEAECLTLSFFYVLRSRSAQPYNPDLTQIEPLPLLRRTANSRLVQNHMQVFGLSHELSISNRNEFAPHRGCPSGVGKPQMQ